MDVVTRWKDDWADEESHLLQPDTAMWVVEEGTRACAPACPHQKSGGEGMSRSSGFRLSACGIGDKHNTATRIKGKLLRQSGCWTRF